MSKKGLMVSFDRVGVLLLLAISRECVSIDELLDKLDAHWLFIYTT
jgi:hypothetical protein